MSKPKTTIHYGVICAVYALLFYTGAILDEKVDHIFKFTVPGAAWFFIFIYPLTDALTEVYGPRQAWANLLAGYVICLVFILITVSTIHFPYVHIYNYQYTQKVYLTVQDALIKCFSFGYLIFFLGMFINIKLLGKWKLKYKGKFYYWRSYFASALSEGFVVIFANILIWQNRATLSQIFKIIITTYLLKLILTFVWAYIGLCVKNILYYLEGENKSYIYNKSLHKNVENK